jgi:hypothetical protein
VGAREARRKLAAAHDPATLHISERFFDSF